MNYDSLTSPVRIKPLKKVPFLSRCDDEARFKPLDGTTASRRPLRCSGVADRARYELGEGIADGSRTVAFLNTAMFQCRVHKFTVRYGTGSGKGVEGTLILCSVAIKRSGGGRGKSAQKMKKKTQCATALK